MLTLFPSGPRVAARRLNEVLRRKREALATKPISAINREILARET